MCGDTGGRVTLSIPAPSRARPTEQDDRQAPAPGLAALRSSIALRSVDDGAAATGRADSMIEKVDCLIEEAMTGGAQVDEDRDAGHQAGNRSTTTSTVADQGLDRHDSSTPHGPGSLGPIVARGSVPHRRCGESLHNVAAKAPICSPIRHNNGYRALSRRPWRTPLAGFARYGFSNVCQRDSQRPGGPFDQSGTVCAMMAA